MMMMMIIIINGNETLRKCASTNRGCLSARNPMSRSATPAALHTHTHTHTRCEAMQYDTYNKV